MANIVQMTDLYNKLITSLEVLPSIIYTLPYIYGKSVKFRQTGFLPLGTVFELVIAGFL